jgi:hypothetical protein
MNVIGIYPVSSQPPHLGHFRAYNALRKITGVNTFVATSDVVELPRSPLNFSEKQQIWAKHGVPIDKIVETKNPYQASEITKKFGVDRTSVIFAMGETEANDLIQKSKGFFQKYSGNPNNLEPMNKRGYILVVNNSLITKGGTNVNASTIRQLFGSKIDIEKKKSFFQQVFGWYDISLFDLISKKFSEASTVKERVDESQMMVFRRRLTPIIKEMLRELLNTPDTATSSMQNTTLINPTESPAQAAKNARMEKDSAKKKLKDLELQKKLRDEKRKNDKKQGDLDVRGLSNQISAAKKEI